MFVVRSDENDQSPVITYPAADNSTFQLSAKTPIGTELLKMEALDLDSEENGKVVFSISKGNEGDFFSIDAATGVLFLNRALAAPPTVPSASAASADSADSTNAKVPSSFQIVLTAADRGQPHSLKDSRLVNILVRRDMDFVSPLYRHRLSASPSDTDSEGTTAGTWLYSSRAQFWLVIMLGAAVSIFIFAVIVSVLCLANHLILSTSRRRGLFSILLSFIRRTYLHFASNRI